MSSDELFLALLAKCIQKVNLDALVVGSVAAALSGVPIATVDVDLLVRNTPLNHKKIRDLAKALGANPPVELSALDSVLRISGAGADVDILFDGLPGNLKFSSLKSRAATVQLGAFRLRVATLEDVLKSKQAVRRPKDLAHISVLEDALKSRHKVK